MCQQFSRQKAGMIIDRVDLKEDKLNDRKDVGEHAFECISICIQLFQEWVFTLTCVFTPN